MCTRSPKPTLATAHEPRKSNAPARLRPSTTGVHCLARTTDKVPLNETNNIHFRRIAVEEQTFFGEVVVVLPSTDRQIALATLARR
jgi:hypothetical protein